MGIMAHAIVNQLSFSKVGQGREGKEMVLEYGTSLTTGKEAGT